MTRSRGRESKIVDIALRAIDAYGVLAAKLASSDEWEADGRIALIYAESLLAALVDTADIVDGRQYDGCFR